MKKALKFILLVLAFAFVLGQFIRPNRVNPPIDAAKVLQAPPSVQSILDRACADCHSNATKWPWYTNITPVNWWIANHVREGRRELNFSEFGAYSAKRAGRKMEEVCEQVERHEMPLKGYAGPLHPEAVLSDADRDRLCEWAKEEEKKYKGGED